MSGSGAGTSRRSTQPWQTKTELARPGPSFAAAAPEQVTTLAYLEVLNDTIGLDPRLAPVS
jgi:hypothetical protein